MWLTQSLTPDTIKIYLKSLMKVYSGVARSVFFCVTFRCFSKNNKVQDCVCSALMSFFFSPILWRSCRIPKDSSFLFGLVVIYLLFLLYHVSSVVFCMISSSRDGGVYFTRCCLWVTLRKRQQHTAWPGTILPESISAHYIKNIKKTRSSDGTFVLQERRRRHVSLLQHLGFRACCLLS